MKELFKEQAQPILFYLGIETDEDPFEHNVTTSELPPLPIRGIVTDLIFSQISWKMPGIITNKAKEIVIEKKYKFAIEQSVKFKILGESEYYYGWKNNGRLQYRIEGEFLRFYIYSKQES